MKTYHVFFKNVFQGEYLATSAAGALDQWIREYKVKDVAGYGNWPVVKKVGK